MKKLFVLVFSVVMVWSGLAMAADPLIFMPFGRGAAWYCTQGPGGPYSHHSQPTLYAYDFNRGGDTGGLKDRAYGEAILSPAHGKVVRIVADLPDFRDNAGSNASNNYGWGNQVIIQDSSSGKFVRINHMQQRSVGVSLDQTVDIGTYLGRVGQTGFSSSPHLHIQVQGGAEHSNSLPFKFVEGPTACGDWNISLNTTRISILDNDGATNLGNDFASTKVTVEGKWDSFKMGRSFTGANYFTHLVSKNNNSARITWTFSVRQTANYRIMITWMPSPNRDRQAYYTILGKPRVVNQMGPADASAAMSGWQIMRDSERLEASKLYTVTLQGTTPGKIVTADSVVLQRL